MFSMVFGTIGEWLILVPFLLGKVQLIPWECMGVAQLESHKPPPAYFLNDDSIYYVNTVSDKRKFNIKIQVADHILMCINVECKLKGGGG